MWSPWYYPQVPPPSMHMPPPWYNPYMYMHPMMQMPPPYAMPPQPPVQAKVVRSKRTRTSTEVTPTQTPVSFTRDLEWLTVRCIKPSSMTEHQPAIALHDLLFCFFRPGLDSQKWSLEDLDRRLCPEIENVCEGLIRESQTRKLYVSPTVLLSVLEMLVCHAFEHRQIFERPDVVHFFRFVLFRQRLLQSTFKMYPDFWPTNMDFPIHHTKIIPDLSNEICKNELTPTILSDMHNIFSFLHFQHKMKQRDVLLWSEALLRWYQWTLVVSLEKEAEVDTAKTRTIQIVPRPALHTSQQQRPALIEEIKDLEPMKRRRNLSIIPSITPSTSSSSSSIVRIQRSGLPDDEDHESIIIAPRNIAPLSPPSPRSPIVPLSPPPPIYVARVIHKEQEKQQSFLPLSSSPPPTIHEYPKQSQTQKTTQKQNEQKTNSITENKKTRAKKSQEKLIQQSKKRLSQVLDNNEEIAEKILRNIHEFQANDAESDSDDDYSMYMGDDASSVPKKKTMPPYLPKNLPFNTVIDILVKELQDVDIRNSILSGSYDLLEYIRTKRREVV